MSRIYKVRTKHPTGFEDGWHTIRVTDNYGVPTVYCYCDEFGCSRDYAGGDEVALKTFLSEHLCEIVEFHRED